jgi:hypothetical protein
VSAAHTPAPWLARVGAFQSIVSSEVTGASVAVVYANDNGDAELIAKAPNLLLMVEAIHALLDGTEWDSDTASAIAAVLTDNGYTIREPEEEPERQAALDLA